MKLLHIKNYVLNLTNKYLRYCIYCVFVFFSSFGLSIDLMSLFFPSDRSIELYQKTHASIKRIDILEQKSIGVLVAPNLLLSNLQDFHLWLKNQHSTYDDIKIYDSSNAALKLRSIHSLSILDDLILLEIETLSDDFVEISSNIPSNDDKLLIRTSAISSHKTTPLVSEFVSHYSFSTDLIGKTKRGDFVFNEDADLLGIVQEFHENILIVLKPENIARFFYKKQGTLCLLLSNPTKCLLQEKKKIEKIAQEGSAIAQYALAIFLKETNPDESFQWVQKAAQQDYTFAQTHIAREYIKKNNKQEAIFWHQKASEQKSPESQYYIAQSLQERELLSHEETNRMIHLYEQLAQKGHVMAQVQFANILQKQDDIEAALYWYKKAYYQGYLDVDCEISQLYHRKELNKTEQENTESLFDWLQRAASRGCKKAQFQLGNYYYSGKKFVQKDFQQSIYWFNRAAKQGDSDSQFALSILYFYFANHKNNHIRQIYMDKFTHWIAKSADNGNPDAIRMIESLISADGE